MNVKEFKDIIASIPEALDEFTVVWGEGSKKVEINEENYEEIFNIRKDTHLTALFGDDEHKELVLCNSETFQMFVADDSEIEEPTKDPEDGE